MLSDGFSGFGLFKAHQTNFFCTENISIDSGPNPGSDLDPHLQSNNKIQIRPESNIFEILGSRFEKVNSGPRIWVGTKDPLPSLFGGGVKDFIKWSKQTTSKRIKQLDSLSLSRLTPTKRPFLFSSFSNFFLSFSSFLFPLLKMEQIS